MEERGGEREEVWRKREEGERERREKEGRERRGREERGEVCVCGGGGEEKKRAKGKKKKMHFVPFIFTCAAYILTTHTYFPPFLSHLCN